MDLESIVREITAKVAAGMAQQQELHQQSVCADPIPVGISNRHVHLSRIHIDLLFGSGYELKSKNPLSQPGQYAAEEVVLLAGPKGTIEKVRVLGPSRKSTQVELLAGDLFKLGISAPIRESGKLDDAADVTIVGPKGAVVAQKSAIIAKRHIHMTPEDAEHYSVHDSQIVSVDIGGERSVTFGEVVVRVSPDFKLELHLDTEEANTASLKNGDHVRLSGAKASGCCGKCAGVHKEAAVESVEKELFLVTEADVKASHLAGRSIRAQKNGVVTALAWDAAKELGVQILR